MMLVSIVFLRILFYYLLLQLSTRPLLQVSLPSHRQRRRRQQRQPSSAQRKQGEERRARFGPAKDVVCFGLAGTRARGLQRPSIGGFPPTPHTQASQYSSVTTLKRHNIQASQDSSATLFKRNKSKKCPARRFCFFPRESELG